MMLNLFCQSPWALIGVLSLLLPLASEETESRWHPHAHPATISRTISGFTQPVATVVISAEDSAPLRQLRAEVGQPTSGDDPIAELDDRSARHVLAQAEAALAEAAARVAQADAELKRAERDRDWWASEERRISSLLSDGRAAQRDADEIRYRRDLAVLSLTSLHQQRASAEAALLRAQAQADHQRHIVERHRIIAPKGWVVAQRLAEPGSLLQPGQGIVELVNTRELEIPLRLSEAELGALSADASNDRVTVTIGENSVAAHLHAIDPRFDPVSRKTLAILRINGKELADPRGGHLATLHISIPDPNGGLRIPRRFLSQDLEQWLVHIDGQRPRRVIPLRIAGDGAIILATDALPADSVLVLPEAHQAGQP